MFKMYKFNEYSLPYKHGDKTIYVRFNRMLVINTVDHSISSLDLTDNSIKKHGYEYETISKNDFLKISKNYQNNGYKWDIEF